MRQHPDVKKDNRPPSRRSERFDIEHRLAQCEATLASIPDGLLVLDEDWRCTYLNEAGATFLKRAAEELIAKVVWEVFPASRYPRLHEELTRAAEQKVSVSFEDFHESFGRWYEWRCYPTDDSLMVLFHDITHRRQAEETLRESEERYRTLFESSRDGIIFTDMEGQILRTNPYYREMLGYTEEELHALTYQQLTPRRWQEMEAAIVRDQVMTRGYSGEYEKEYLCKNGTVFPVSIQVWLIRDGHGRPQGMWGIVRDITERKRAEEALRESEERLRLAQQAGRVGVFDRDLQNNTAVWTPELEELFGVPAGTFEGRPEDWAKRVYPEDLPRLRSFLQEWMQSERTENTWEYRFIRADGQVRWMEGRGRIFRDPSGKPLRMVGTNMDITERKQADKALRESEEKYRTLFDSIDEGFCIIEMVFDADGKPADYRFLEINPAFEKQTGLHEAKGKLMRTLAPDHEAHWFEIYGKIALTGEPARFTNEARALNRWYDVYAFRIRTQEGKKVAILFNDITARKRTEDQLQETHRRLNLHLDTSPLAVIEWDSDFHITRWAGEAAKVFGWTSEEVLGKYINELPWVYEEDWPGVKQVMEDMISGRRPRNVSKNRNVRKDGTIIYCEWYNSAISDASGRLVSVLSEVLEVTERNRAEEALRELNTTLESKVAQRTAELQHRARQLQRLTLELSETEDRERRQLAEILHDDLQQQLAAAKFHLSLLNNRAKHDPAQQAIVTQVDQILMEAIQKSRSLSHELSPAVLYHGDFVGALTWLAGQLQTKHGLEVKVDAFGPVNVESDALKSFLYKAAQEMLFNVVKHARVNEARVRVRRFARCVCLSVSDRGRGFDPQEVRQAKGFGLLSIRERVELLGGRMKMHSVKGKGSTFHVVVPDGPMVETGYASLEDLSHAHAGVLVPGAASTQPKLRVLLADDHEIVREGLISLLSDIHDIEVVGEAANGREAVNQAYRLQPDVVIMDVAMPLINGDDATRQIKLHLPKTRVIALSMYEEPDMVEKMRRAGAEDYILKTAPSEVLVAAIRGKRPQPVPT